MEQEGHARVDGEEVGHREEMKYPANRRFPVGFASSVGGLGPSALAQSGATVDGIPTKNGLGRSAVVGDPSTAADGYGRLGPARTRRRDDLDSRSKGHR